VRLSLFPVRGHVRTFAIRLDGSRAAETRLPSTNQLGVNGRAGRDIRDVLRLPERLEQLVLRHQDRRLELAERTTGADCNRDARARDVVRCLDQGEAVTLAERIPETLQLAACVLEDPADGLRAVFRAVDQLGPDLGLVAEGRHIEGHNTSLSDPAPSPRKAESPWPRDGRGSLRRAADQGSDSRAWY